MTADVELLPLPEADDSVENHAQWPIVIDSDVWLQKSVQDYALANVAHHTAAKDAEIEALREQLDWMARQNDGLLNEGREHTARAERMAEALALLPDETDMIEHNPDEGLLMFCCGRAVKSQGLYDLLITHDEDCWYVSMCALRDHDQEGKDG